jgi:DNA-binding MarR family transcriptional regulator
MSKPVPFATTIHVRDHCLCLQTQRAARTLARHFDDAFRSLGLTSGQFSLMMSLNRPEPPTMGAVAELLAMDRTTLTAALKPLERRGLVTVAADASDRRARRPALTGAGERLLAEAAVIWRDRHAAIDRLAGPDLGSGLARVVAGLRTGPTEEDSS